MTGEPLRFLGRSGAMPVIGRRPLDEHDGQAENARGDDLAVGGLAAGILADDHLDPLFAKKSDLVLHREGAAGQQVFDLRRIERRIDGIDAAHEIAVLRRGIEGLCLLPADGEEDAARVFPERCDGVGRRGDARPAVAVRFVPAMPLQSQKRNAGFKACGAGIGGNLPGEGMRGVDQEIDRLRAEIIDEARHTAEAAAAHRHGLRGGVDRAAGQRKRDGKIVAFRQARGEFAGFGRSAQYEDASLVHA